MGFLSSIIDDINHTNEKNKPDNFDEYNKITERLQKKIDQRRVEFYTKHNFGDKNLKNFFEIKAAFQKKYKF